MGWRERKGPGTIQGGRRYYETSQTHRLKETAQTHRLRKNTCVKAGYRGGRAVNTGDGNGETPQNTAPQGCQNGQHSRQGMRRPHPVCVPPAPESDVERPLALAT